MQPNTRGTGGPKGDRDFPSTSLHAEHPVQTCVSSPGSRGKDTLYSGGGLAAATRLLACFVEFLQEATKHKHTQLNVFSPYRCVDESSAVGPDCVCSERVRVEWAPAALWACPQTSSGYHPQDPLGMASFEKPQKVVSIFQSSASFYRWVK